MPVCIWICSDFRAYGELGAHVGHAVPTTPSASSNEVYEVVRRRGGGGGGVEGVKEAQLRL